MFVNFQSSSEELQRELTWEVLHRKLLGARAEAIDALLRSFQGPGAAESGRGSVR